VAKIVRMSCEWVRLFSSTPGNGPRRSSLPAGRASARDAHECVTILYSRLSSFLFSKDDTFCTPFRRHSRAKSRIVDTVAAEDCDTSPNVRYDYDP
jgi:hypothetical protein